MKKRRTQRCIAVFAMLSIVASMFLTVQGYSKEDSLESERLANSQGTIFATKRLVEIGEDAFWKMVNTKKSMYKSALWKNSDGKNLSIYPMEGALSAIDFEQVKSVADCSELDLKDLTLEEKCQVLAAWVIQDNPHRSNCFGLVDVTQDGCPEFFTQNPSYEFGTCVLYDISEEHPKEIAEFWTGVCQEDVNKFWGWIPENENDIWRIYKTVFPRGDAGVIIETSGMWKTKSIYFSSMKKGNILFEDCIEICAEYTQHSFQSNDKIEYGYSIDYVLYGEFSPEWKEKVSGTWDEAEWISRPEEMSDGEFQTLIQGSWLDILNKLPRLPWYSPIVRDSNVFGIALGRTSWDEICQAIHQLMIDYDQAVAEYDPISPITSGAPG